MSAPYDQNDGPDTMLPSAALRTLACLARCAANTQAQQAVYREVMRIALLFKSSSSLSMRIATFAAIHASVESWHHLRTRPLDISVVDNSPVGGKSPHFHLYHHFIIPVLIPRHLGFVNFIIILQFSAHERDGSRFGYCRQSYWQCRRAG